MCIRDRKEGAHFHLFAGLDQRADVFRIENDDLAGTKLFIILIPEIQIRKALEAGAEAILFFAEDNGGAAQLIAGGIDALGREDQHTEGAVDDLLCIADTVDEVILLVCLLYTSGIFWNKKSGPGGKSRAFSLLKFFEKLTF